MEKNELFDDEFLAQISGGYPVFAGLAKEDLAKLALVKDDAELAELLEARGIALADDDLALLRGRLKDRLARPRRGGESLGEELLTKIGGGFPIGKVLPREAIDELALVHDEKGLDDLLARHQVSLTAEQLASIKAFLVKDSESDGKRR